MVQPPLKHVVQYIGNGLGTGNISQVLAVGTLNPDPYTNPTNIKATNIIRKIILLIDVGLQGDEFAAASIVDFDVYLGFNINGAQPMPIASSVMTSHISNQVFWQEQAKMFLTTGAAATAQPKSSIWRVEVKIPPSWSKLGDGDTLELHWSVQAGAGVTWNVKWTAIYKEVYP